MLLLPEKIQSHKIHYLQIELPQAIINLETALLDGVMDQQTDDKISWSFSL